jgi:flagellar M-ring protein FliF
MDLKNYISSLAAPMRRRLLIGAALIILLTAAALWWVFLPRQQLLFGNLREADAAEIVQSLNEWKVPHEIVADGAAINVPADRVYETRMRLVSAGVPRGGHVGFELFDDSDFGVTEFAQRVNYQRALQGEIERTIASLPGVETARVHLTIRRPGLFVGERESSKASVALTLKPGETLSRQQVSGIRSLVAAAVEGLSLEAVSVLNSDGALLAGAGGVGAGLDDRSEEEGRLEERIRARVSELLGQVLHDEEFRVSVDVTLNFDAVREVHERPSALGEAITAREEISRAPGRVQRLSVAVILPPELDELEAPRIQSLIAAAAGIDPERGDRLEVSRLGRNQSWRAAGAVSRETVSAASETLDLSVKNTGRSLEFNLGQPWKWLLIAAAGMLLGIIIAVAAMHRPRALKPSEREAVLAKLRGWLAEGSQQA